MAVASSQLLKPDGGIPPILFSFRAVLTILGSSYLYMNFEISLSISTKEMPAGIFFFFIGTALNL